MEHIEEAKTTIPADARFWHHARTPQNLGVCDKSSASACPSCGSAQTDKLMSATSSLTGRESRPVPGPHDTACCGSRPGENATCAGPGSCCSNR